MNKQFTLADLLQQSVYSRLAGYEDLNDAERLRLWVFGQMLPRIYVLPVRSG